ncbi:MAG: mechanosensitive ion channel family protein [Muribaculaceae bacterium]|nr:mechanosensitive ion channel family protein [Muribaculaceae bacterium]
MTEPVDTVSSAASAARAFQDLSLNDLLSQAAHGIVKLAINVVIALIVFYVGRFIIRRIYAMTNSVLLRRNVDASLCTFILSTIKIVLYFILIITVIGILGIETSSFLALFASAGVAVGMAMSGTLQNFAGGVLILLLKPYKIGDYIEAQGYAGTVKEIQIFHTIITTGDNKGIIIPNGGLSTSSINNWSRELYRRVTWTVGISYGDDVSRVRQAILDMFAADPDIVTKYSDEHYAEWTKLQDEKSRQAGEEPEEHPADPSASPLAESPEQQKENEEEDARLKPTLWNRIFHRDKVSHSQLKDWKQRRKDRLDAIKKQQRPDRSPAVYVEALADSSVNLSVRAWVPTKIYWSVFFRYNEKFLNELPHNGGHFPFPQMDVHINPVNPD